MIPYDELVAALASWRARQGLPSGPADYLGEPAAASHSYAPPASAYSDDVVELSEDMVDGMVNEQSSRYATEDEFATPSPDGAYPEVEAYVDAALEETPPPEAAPDPEPSSGHRKRRR